MPWSGAGTYTLPPAFSPEVNGTTIDATRYNGLTSDVATGITAALAKNGENVPTANLPMGSFKHTGAASASATGQYLVYGQSGASLTTLTITGAAIIQGGQTLGLGRANAAENAVSLAIGVDALKNNTTGQNNVAVGYENLKANTTGFGNTALGVTALLSNTSGDYNTALGIDALYTNIAGYSNTAVGADALGFNIDGRENAAVGFDALFKNTYGNNNTAIGFKALFENLTGTGLVAVGNFAGHYETASNAFYVNNQDRGSTANDKSLSLLYGVFAATAAAQTLRINAATTVYGNTALGMAATDTLSVAGAVVRSSAGAWTLPVPTSGTALTINTLPASQIGTVWTDGTTTAVLQQVGASGTWFGTTSAHRVDFLTSNTARASISSGGVFTYGGNEVGFRGLPTASVTTGAFVAADAGKCVYATAGVTIPNAVMSAENAVVVQNTTGSGITITKTVTTAYNTATGSAFGATFTLAARGRMSVVFTSGTECYVSGNVS